MKTILNLILALCITTALSATEINKKSNLIFSTKKIELRIDQKVDEHFFQKMSFDINGNSLKIQTAEVISIVQIFDNNGKMQYQLPVTSNKLQICKTLFDNGDYKIGFILEGQSDIVFSDLKIKE